MDHVVPRYVTLPAKPATADQIAHPSAPLPTWNGSFTYNGTTYNYNMVGHCSEHRQIHHRQDFHYPCENIITGCTSDPTVDSEDGHTVQYLTTHSPIFKT